MKVILHNDFVLSENDTIILQKYTEIKNGYNKDKYFYYDICYKTIENKLEHHEYISYPVNRTNKELISFLETNKIKALRIEEIAENLKWVIDTDDSYSEHIRIIDIKEEYKNYIKSIENKSIWYEDLYNKNTIELKFHRNSLIVSKKLIISRSEVIKEYIKEEDANELTFEIAFTDEEIDIFVKYLIESNFENKNNSIVKFLNIN